jgi:predicted nucleic acid-binding protein
MRSKVRVKKIITYEDKKLSFTDYTSFALMRKRCIENVFSFDRDFEKIGFILMP